MKKKILIGVIFVLVVVIAGVSAIAASNFGTSSDPLVALSYLTDKLTPEILDQVDDAIAAQASDVQDSLQAQIDALEGETGLRYHVVTLSQGQTLVCEVGTEIMLRIGTATATGPDYPQLIDMTTASSVSSGTALVTNHMYMVTIQDNGITATASTVKVLVRGSYTIA